MSPSVAVLRIWAHPDMGILSHSSEKRFRGGRFPLGSPIARLLDSGSVSSNRLESQWEWVMDLAFGCCQDVPCLSMEFRIISNLRMHAVSATFLGFPADRRRW